MSSKKNKELYSPSSLNMRGYNSKKSKYNMMYSNHSNGMGYSFDYALRRKLNYIFNYLLHPKYGRYTFIYDITEKIHNENSVINMYPYDKKLLSNEDKEYCLSLNPTKDISENISDEFNVRKNIDSYHIFYESVMANMNNVDKMIGDYYEYSKSQLLDRTTRDLTLLSTDVLIQNENSKNREIETIYDFLLDRCFDVDITTENDMSMKRNDILERMTIEESLKNDLKMRRIVEEIFVDKISQSFIDKVETDIANADSYVGIAKADKCNSVPDEVSTLKEAIRKAINEHESEFILNKDYKKVAISNDDIPVGINIDLNKFTTETDEHFVIPYLQSNIFEIEEDISSSRVRKKEYDAKIESDIHKMEKRIEHVLNVTDKDIITKVKKDTPKNVLNTDDINPSIFMDKACTKHIFGKDDNDNRLEKYSNKVLDTENQKEQFLNSYGAREAEFNLDKIEFLDNYGDKETYEQHWNFEQFVNNYGDKETYEQHNCREQFVNNYGDKETYEQHNCHEQFVDNYGDKKSDEEYEQFLDNYGDKKLNQEAEFNIGKAESRELITEDINILNRYLKCSIDKTDDEELLSYKKAKTLEQEFEERLDLHKRFWFVKSMGKVDYKILPNVDFNYPVDIELFVEKPDFIYLFEFECEYKDITSDNLIIDLYDYNYKKYESFKIDSITTGTYSNNNVRVEIESRGNRAVFQIKINNHENLYYMIIRQPEDVNGYPVIYTVTKKFLEENHHPIPFGEDMGTREIPVHINIMVDFINILMLMWSKFYYQFTGYTGTQAVYGLLNLVYEWLTLETSSEIYDIEDYYRCFRWLRWEAEKVYNIARHDPELTGNAWVEKLIYELIEYMEMHHMDEMPMFEPIHLMDEYRNIFDDPSFDIDIVVEKVKGVRKKVIDTNKVRRNQKNKD